jgi:predicted transcriptional regulator
MTMLDRLTRKQFLARRKVGRSFYYRPQVSRDEIRALAVRELVDLLFDGSPQSLAEFLAGAPLASSRSRVEAPQEADIHPLDAALL